VDGQEEGERRPEDDPRPQEEAGEAVDPIPRRLDLGRGRRSPALDRADLLEDDGVEGPVGDEDAREEDEVLGPRVPRGREARNGEDEVQGDGPEDEGPQV